MPSYPPYGPPHATPGLPVQRYSYTGGYPQAIEARFQSDPRLVQALSSMQAGSSTAPVQSPLEGLARALQGVVGGISQGNIKQEYDQQADQHRTQLAEALAAMGGDNADLQRLAQLDPDAALRAALTRATQEPDNELVQAVENGQLVWKPKSEAAGMQAELPPAPDAPTVKDFYEGGNVVQKQWDPKSNTWVAMGSGPRFEPDKPRAPTDLETKLAQAGQLYPQGSPEHRAAIEQIIGAASSAEQRDLEIKLGELARIFGDGTPEYNRAVAQMLGASGDAAKPVSLAAGSMLVDPSTGQPIANNPAAPPKPTELDTKLEQLRDFYPNGGPEYQAAVERMIGAAVKEGTVSQDEARIAALVARDMSREEAENLVYGLTKPMQNPQTGDVTMVDTTTGTGQPVTMPGGLPRSVATDLTAQQTVIAPVIDEIAALKNQITGQGVGLVGNALNIWNRTAGQGLPGSVNETNIDQRTMIAAARERVIQAISGDPRFSNQDRARIEQLLPSTGIFESAERARQNLDELEKLLRQRSATIARQLGSGTTTGGNAPPPGMADPLAGAPSGPIENMNDDALLSLDPATLSPADRKKLSDRLKSMGY